MATGNDFLGPRQDGLNQLEETLLGRETAPPGARDAPRFRPQTTDGSSVTSPSVTMQQPRPDGSPCSARPGPSRPASDDKAASDFDEAVGGTIEITARMLYCVVYVAATAITGC